MRESVMHNLRLEYLELGAAGKVAIEEQVRDFQEA